MDNTTKLFPTEIREMVLNKEARHASIQPGKIFVEAKLTDNGDVDEYFRLAYVASMTVDGKPYNNLCVATECKTLQDVADKLRNGFFGIDKLHEAAQLRDRIEFEREVVRKADEAQKGADNE